jgi:hypothetical protein
MRPRIAHLALLALAASAAGQETSTDGWRPYAARRGTSVSSLVESYLDLVSRRAGAGETQVAPLLGRLRAELEGLRGDEGSYGRYLQRKYR